MVLKCICCTHLRCFPENKNRAVSQLYTIYKWGTQSCVLRVAVFQSSVVAFRTFRGGLIPAHTFLLYSLFFSKADGPRSHAFGKLPQPHPSPRMDSAVVGSKWKLQHSRPFCSPSVGSLFSSCHTNVSFLYFLSLCDRYSSFHKIKMYHV